MKKYDSILKALRRVKWYSKSMGFFDDIYVAYGDCPKTFLVAYDYGDILKYIEKEWRDSGCELRPQEYADMFRIIHYIPLTKVEQYKSTHQGYIPASMETDVPLARKEYEANVVETVNFYLKV